MQTRMAERAGIACGLGAAIIGGGWPVVTSVGMQTALTPYEIVILRVIIAGPILFPLAIRGDNSFKSWFLAILLAVIAGGTFNLVAAHGFLHAPASHGGLIIPGTVLLVSLLAGHWFLCERLTSIKVIGSCAIILGLCILSFGADAKQNVSWKGDLFFMVAGMMWGIYAFLLRILKLDPLIAVARISFLSFITITIFHLIIQPDLHLLELPRKMFFLQLIYQGVLISIMAVLMFSASVSLLGVSQAGAINAFTPIVTIILAFFLLKEIPSWLETVGIITIFLGIVAALRIRKLPKMMEQ